MPHDIPEQFPGAVREAARAGARQLLQHSAGLERICLSRSDLHRCVPRRRKTAHAPRRIARRRLRLRLAGRSPICSPSEAAAAVENPLAPQAPHFPPRAKRVIFLFMHGGPSSIDTFDPKPRLDRDNGKPLPFKRPLAFAEGDAGSADEVALGVQEPAGRAASRSATCSRMCGTAPTTCAWCARWWAKVWTTAPRCCRRSPA